MIALTKDMICQYNLWLVITFVLGHVPCGLWRPWKARGLRTWEASLAKARCQWENSAGSDVIVVGAGVAGSALAYALGKVNIHITITFFNIHIDTPITWAMFPFFFFFFAEYTGKVSCTRHFCTKMVT